MNGPVNALRRKVLRPWKCQTCGLRLRMRNRSFFTARRQRLEHDSIPNAAERYAESMEAAKTRYRLKNATVLNYTLSLLVGTIALSYGSVPLYKTICQQMGWGGQPVRSKTHAGPSADDPSSLSHVTPVSTSPRIRITFSSSVSSVLPWTFTPQQRDVRIRPGETALAFYTAENKGPDDIIGVATYSVTPPQVAPYFSKIQCFCFEEQRLNAGEKVDMPVFFYIDPEFVKDPAVRKIETVTLHYTFFKAKYDKDGHSNPVPMNGLR